LKWKSLNYYNLKRKKSYRKSILKYSPENIRYYGVFITTIFYINPFRIKFCDECHFVCKNLYAENCWYFKRKKTLSIPLNCYNLNETFSITLTSTLTGVIPFILDIRRESNTGQGKYYVIY